MTSLSSPMKPIKSEPDNTMVTLPQIKDEKTQDSEEEELYIDASSDTDLEVSDTEENQNNEENDQNKNEDLETRVANLTSMVKQVSRFSNI